MKRRAKPKVTQMERGPRIYQMSYGLGRWYWKNKESRWVDLRDIPDVGIMKLLGMLAERGPRKYYLIMEEVAMKRGLITNDGRTHTPRDDPMEATTA